MAAELPGRCAGPAARARQAHPMLVITWRVLALQQPYVEPGVDCFTRRSYAEAHARRLAREIEKLGFQVTIESRPPDRTAVGHRGRAAELTPATEQ